jgi:phage terminase small subunit
MAPRKPTSAIKITAKMQRFVEEYLKDSNASAAAERAGYGGGKNGAAVMGHRLLQNPVIAARIQEARAAQHGQVSKDFGAPVLDPDRVLREVEHIAYMDPLHALNEDGTPKKISEIPEATRRAISKIKVRIDGEGAQTVELSFWDKPKGLEMLGKRLKLFTEKVELTGEGGEPLQIVVQTYKEGEGK